MYISTCFSFAEFYFCTGTCLSLYKFKYKQLNCIKYKSWHKVVHNIFIFFFFQNTNCKVCSGYIGIQLFSRFYVFGFVLNFLIYYLFIIFIFGCVGSSFLCEGFLQLRRAGATLRRGARASHYRGLSCGGAQAPDAQAQ